MIFKIVSVAVNTSQTKYKLIIAMLQILQKTGLSY